MKAMIKDNAPVTPSFEGAKKRYGKDKGDLVQTIIIIAGFAVAAIVAIGMLSSTLMNKSEAAAGCIAGSSNFSAGGEARTNCEKVDKEAGKQSADDITKNGGTGTIYTGPATGA